MQTNMSKCINERALLAPVLLFKIFQGESPKRKTLPTDQLPQSLPLSLSANKYEEVIKS